MEDIVTLAAHRQTITRLIPLLDAIRSVAEIAWRRAQQDFQPLTRYYGRVHSSLEGLFASLNQEERQAISAGWASHRPTALLLVTSERGLCGPFNERVVSTGLREARALSAQGKSVQYLCLGSRGSRLIDASENTVLYRQPLPSFSLPSYNYIEEVALDLLDFLDAGAFGQLLVVHSAPVRQFEYGVVTEAMIPPDLSQPDGPQRRLSVKPESDLPALVTHLLAEHLLIRLYRAVMESVISEQLARIHTMRLASENAGKLLDGLTMEYNLARKHEETTSLMEIISGYEATLDDYHST
jgi:F-type H+-transporting ATPase subunit gamma